MNSKTKLLDKRNIILIFLVGLSSKLLALPFSKLTSADSITRMWDSIFWLADPKIILYGWQGPLHLYLLGLSLFIGNNSVIYPIILHILFSTATAILLYLFTKVEFNSSSAGIFVAFAFLFYPLAFRNSLLAMPETIFIFFLALSIYLLALEFRNKGNYTNIILSGLSLTLAGMIRFEGWLLIPLLGILLIKTPKKMFVFILIGSIFPISWLMGNYIHFGNAFYSMQWSTNWELNIVGANEGLTFLDYIKRIVFFPASIFMGITPITAILSLLGLYIALKNKMSSVRWLIPIIGLMGSLVLFGIRGSLDIQPRYTLSIGIVLLPFLAVAYNSWKIEKNKKNIIFSLVIISMIPLSYIGNLIPQTRNFYIAGINPIPQLKKESQEFTDQVLEVLINNTEESDFGLISDYYGYKETYYVLSASKFHPQNIFIAPGEKYEVLNIVDFTQFINSNPDGLIILVENSGFSNTFINVKDGYFEVFDIPIFMERIKQINTDPEISIYKYKVE